MATNILESEELVENACCVCLKKGRCSNADKYCIHCADYFCSTCLDTIHAFMPSTNGHKILERSDFKSLTGPNDESLPNIPTQRCTKHPSRILDIYCGEHDEVVCASCVLDHRSCGNLMPVSENVDTLNTKSKMKDTKQNMKSHKAALEEELRNKEQNAIDLKKCLESAVYEVYEFRKKLQTLIEEAEIKTISQMKEEQSKTEVSINAEISKIKRFLNSIDTMLLELEKTTTNKVQEFVCVKMCEKISTQVQEVRRQEVHFLPNATSFTADRTIETYLGQLQTLGDIGTTLTRNMSKTSEKQKTSELNTGSFIPKTSIYNVIQMKKLNVSKSDDKDTCDIHGSCLNEDGCLFLADVTNRKLKRLDLKTPKVRDSLNLNSRPCAVCSVNNKEVAVSLMCPVCFCSRQDDLYSCSYS